MRCVRVAADHDQIDRLLADLLGLLLAERVLAGAVVLARPIEQIAECRLARAIADEATTVGLADRQVVAVDRQTRQDPCAMHTALIRRLGAVLTHADSIDEAGL